MGIQTLELSKLLSPKPGMDLKQGVPGNSEKVGSTESSSFEKHFEKSKGLVARHQEASQAKDAPQSERKSEEKPVVRSNTNSQKTQKSKLKLEAARHESSASEDEEITSSEPSDVQSVSSDAEPQDESASTGAADSLQDHQAAEVDADASDLQTLIAAMNVMAAPSTNSAQVKPVQGDEKLSDEVPVQAANGNAEMLDEIPASNLQLNNVLKNQPIVSGESVSSNAVQANSKKVESKHSTAFDAKAAQAELDQMSELEDLSDPESSQNFQSFLNAADLGQNADSQQPAAPSLKSLVDKLFIESKIESSTPTSLLATSGEQKFETVMKAQAAGPVMRNQLVSDMKPLISHVISNQNGGEMTLNLRPAELGLVRVEVKVDSGNVRVAIHAEQADAKRMLQSQMSELKEQLTNAGLKVHEISVQTMKFERQESARQNLGDQQRQQQQSSHQNQNSPQRNQGTQFEEALGKGEGKEAA